MADKGGLVARFAGLYKTAYEQHYIPYLYFFYGGEYLHYSDDPAARIAELPYSTSREAREKAP